MKINGFGEFLGITDCLTCTYLESLILIVFQMILVELTNHFSYKTAETMELKVDLIRLKLTLTILCLYVNALNTFYPFGKTNERVEN
jgi:hypothetical protein